MSLSLNTRGLRRTLSSVRPYSIGALGALLASLAGPGSAVGASTAPEDLMFVLNPNMGFVSYESPESLDGPKNPVSCDLALSPKTILAPTDVALDGRGALYFASGAQGGSIAVYEDPRLATGSRQPDRRVTGARTQIKRPIGMTIDRENHLLYLLLSRSAVHPDVLVFDLTSPESFDGDIAPIRTFDIDVTNFHGKQIRLAGGRLYLANARGDKSEILAFDSPDQLRGKATADRVITSPGFGASLTIEVDTADRLLVTAIERGEVQIFEGISALDGPQKPSVTLTVAGVITQRALTFATTDSDGRLYLSDSLHCAIYAFDELASLTSGEHFPSRTIDTRGTLVPKRLLLLEE